MTNSGGLMSSLGLFLDRRCLESFTRLCGWALQGVLVASSVASAVKSLEGQGRDLRKGCVAKEMISFCSHSANNHYSRFQTFFHCKKVILIFLACLGWHMFRQLWIYQAEATWPRFLWLAGKPLTKRCGRPSKWLHHDVTYDSYEFIWPGHDNHRFQVYLPQTSEKKKKKKAHLLPGHGDGIVRASLRHAGGQGVWVQHLLPHHRWSVPAAQPKYGAIFKGNFRGQGWEKMMFQHTSVLWDFQTFLDWLWVFVYGFVKLVGLGFCSQRQTSAQTSTIFFLSKRFFHIPQFHCSNFERKIGVNVVSAKQ